MVFPLYVIALRQRPQHQGAHRLKGDLSFIACSLIYASIYSTNITSGIRNTAVKNRQWWMGKEGENMKSKKAQESKTTH